MITLQVLKPMIMKSRLLLIPFMCFISSCINESHEQQEVLLYTNIEHDLSFRYSSNWEQQVPQLKSTLCLFHEKQVHASCNLSFVKADRNMVEEYDEVYMSNNAKQVMNEVKNLTVRFEKLIGRKFSICTLDFKLSMTPEGEMINFKSIQYTTIANGNRYMMIFNVPLDNYDLIKSEINIMASTLFIETYEKPKLTF